MRFGEGILVLDFAFFARQEILIRQESKSSSYAKGAKEDATRYAGTKGPFGIQRPGMKSANEVERNVGIKYREWR